MQLSKLLTKLTQCNIELNDYQKGMVDAIVGIFGMILSEMDDEMKNCVLKELHFERKDE